MGSAGNLDRAGRLSWRWPLGLFLFIVVMGYSFSPRRRVWRAEDAARALNRTMRQVKPRFCHGLI
jgi:hypothetical protein